MLGRRLNNDPFQRVIYLDSHDSAANGSSYFSETISPNNSDSLFARKQALIAATLLLTCPGLPMVFQGQEFLQSGSFSDWQGVDWKKSYKNKKIVDAYKKLIELRKNVLTNSKGLTGANCNVMHFDDTNKVIGYHRWSNGGQGDDVMVIVNFGNNSFVNYSFNVPNDGVWNVRFYSTDKKYINESRNELAESYIAEHGNLSLFLPASTAIVLSQ
jgi:1,4-alpha-glucan branching enzyme